ncbi:MAG: sugar nucleotide-binding protein [Planctomycetota bacterium]
MRVLITGFNGTLAPYVQRAYAARGDSVSGWDRQAVSPDDAEACAAHLDRVAPDRVIHLAMGAEAWAARLAGWCAEHNAGLVFTSTAMVFADRPDGPHDTSDERTADEDYGRYKTRCEDAVLGASPSAIVARIGWQIGDGRGGNHMFEHLSAEHERNGVLRPSRRWRPACSFMADTADALLGLADRGEPGVFHVDANARACEGRGMTFHEIVESLCRKHALDWRIEPNDEYVRDQRLIDDRVKLPTMSERLLV